MKCMAKKENVKMFPKGRLRKNEVKNHVSTKKIHLQGRQVKCSELFMMFE